MHWIKGRSPWRDRTGGGDCAAPSLVRPSCKCRCHTSRMAGSHPSPSKPSSSNSDMHRLAWSGYICVEWPCNMLIRSASPLSATVRFAKSTMTGDMSTEVICIAGAIVEAADVASPCCCLTAAAVVNRVAIMPKRPVPQPKSKMRRGATTSCDGCCCCWRVG